MDEKRYEIVELLKQLSEKMHTEQKVEPDDVALITSTLAAFMEKFYKAGCIGYDE